MLLLSLMAGYKNACRSMTLVMPAVAVGYDPWWRSSGGTTHVSTYEEGTLVPDVISLDKKQLVWRGTGTGVVGEPENPDKMQEKADKLWQRYWRVFRPVQGLIEFKLRARLYIMRSALTNRVEFWSVGVMAYWINVPGSFVLDITVNRRIMAARRIHKMRLNESDT